MVPGRCRPSRNCHGCGAGDRVEIEIRTNQQELSRETTIGGGHAGGQLGWIHFGLGKADRAEVRIQWPDGETGPWMEVDVNRFTVINGDSSGPRVWAPTTG